MNIILPVIAAVAVFGGGGWWFSQQEAAPGVTALDPFTEVADEAVDTSGVTEMYLGDADAPLTVVEYASYTCPHCANFHSGVFKQLKENYIDTGKVKFVYREVYFDKYGMWASLIARCEPTRFFGITDMLYAGQKDWARAGSDAAIAEELRKVGLLAGLDNATLDSCLSDGDKLRMLVTWFQENATRDSIRSTPSFLVDGELMSNMNYADFSAELDKRLGE